MNCVGRGVRRKGGVLEGSSKKVSSPARPGRRLGKRPCRRVPRSEGSGGVPQGTKVPDSLLQAQGVKRRTVSKEVQDRSTQVRGGPSSPPQGSAVGCVERGNPASPRNSELQSRTKHVPPNNTPGKQGRHSKGLSEHKAKRTVTQPLVRAVSLQQVKVTLRQRQAVKGLALTTGAPAGVVTAQPNPEVPVTGNLGDLSARDSEGARAVQ